MPKPTIEERENGPLIVKNADALKHHDGDALEVKEVMALCRCGASKNKPFCDGTHNEIGFESRGGKPSGLNKLITYEGAEVAVTYNPMLCSHAAECGRLAPQVFNPAQKPWVQPDNGARAEVEAVVAACPSGALALKDGDGQRHLTLPRAAIEIEKNGPYWVTGADAPAEMEGAGATAEKYVLCRCGKSGNKPYCDGAHRDAGWTDD